MHVSQLLDGVAFTLQRGDAASCVIGRIMSETGSKFDGLQVKYVWIEMEMEQPSDTLVWPIAATKCYACVVATEFWQ